MPSTMRLYNNPSMGNSNTSVRGRGASNAGAPLEVMFDLQRLGSGDKAEWDRFVRRAGPLIYAAVLRRLAPAGRSGDAQDVAQEVFLRLARRDRPLAGYD